MTFADRLKNLRSLAGESQKYLANILGISDVMISQYENGKKMPGREMMKKIAKHYGTTLSDLWGESGDTLSDELIILNRGAKKMTPEKQKQLLEMAKVMFKEEFTEDDD